MIVAIVGPTASGKSALGMQVAQYLPTQQWFKCCFSGGVEIVGADAMALYRGMDIGTAKASKKDRELITHHQIDVLWPNETASVRAYQKHARADIAKIWSRRALPLLVGGSGLYLRGALDRFEFPPTDAKVRARLTERLEKEGAQPLFSLLEQLDARAAAHINPQNGRRIVRALEAIEITGKPFSATLPDGNYYHEPTLQFYLDQTDETLRTRIQERTAHMFASGLVTETENLLADTAHPLGLTAAKATGYAQTIAYLNGEYSMSQAQDLVAQATWQLAKKQRKWFKRDQRLINLTGLEENLALERAVGEIRAALDQTDAGGGGKNVE